MTTTDFIELLLLIIILGQVTFLSVRTYLTRRQQNGDMIFVDTSALMDGRLLSIASAGFITASLVVPRSVLGELQLLADKGDTEKRSRARRGLEVVRELQEMELVDVRILQDTSRAFDGVDNQLIALAKKYGGRICTTDFNLQKVAEVEGIKVLNVNELAKQLRMVYLPGDSLTIDLTQVGSDKHQAVGHLEDGTMVVVENASKYIGKSVEIEIIRSLQTSAGRMMFAKRTNLTEARTIKSSSSRQKATKNSGQTRQHPKPASRRTKEDELLELVNRA